jgi:hypothetical protein
MSGYSLSYIGVSTITVSFSAVYVSEEVTVSSVRYFTTLTFINGVAALYNMSELLFFTTISFGLTYEAIAITGYYFTHSWIRINLPNERDPQPGASAAVIAGIATGTVVLILLIVVIGVHLIRNAKDESETSGEVADLGGEKRIANEPGLLDEEEPTIDDPPIDPNLFSRRMASLSGLDDAMEELFI